MTYNYYDAMKDDVTDYINNEIERADWIDNRDGLESELNDTLWIEDSVTGNASGSYTFNRNTARDYVTDNMDLLEDAMEEFGTPNETIADKFLSDNWEFFDVSIRCYLLSGIISDVLDDMENNGYFDEPEETEAE